jgi:hypothetical protein
MKGAAFLAIALLFLAAMPVLVRCETTFLNEQFTLDSSDPQNNSALRVYKIELKSGDKIGITLNVSGQGSVDLDIYNSSSQNLLDKVFQTQGFQGQWIVPYDDTFDFDVAVLLLGQPISVTVTITLTSAGTGSQAPSIISAQGGVGVGGGFDPLPIVVIVMILLAVLISTFFIVRLRKQPPPPPPAEGQPPPPP